MVITDDLSNDTVLLQLRCKMNRRVKGRHAVKQDKNKKYKARINSSFVETTIYWVIFNIGQKEKTKQNNLL